ncbi:MAG: ribonuclease HII [Pseudothermotoga sp.]|nr:ribonuclease HII [Pseudothermotoga sp.]MCX7813649.1 ribonuclease HII [Pseudothermotoga sp.]MDW8139504.1 ribonuclease HII [Pseudothermotoga sp.]
MLVLLILEYHVISMRRELFLFDDFYRASFGTIIGIDEAGRGCLAGPVVAAAVILLEPVDVYDSKKLTPKQREILFMRIQTCAKVGVGIATPEEIDVYNILNATKVAMNRALENLNCPSGFVLVDGKSLKLSQQGVCVVKGDMKSASIAAASIVAKVTRDRLMEQFDKQYPNYGFTRHKGYSTKEHLKSLHRYGPTSFHRLTFKPVLNLLNERLLAEIVEKDTERFRIVLQKLKQIVAS